jgi:hypothetical protein
MPMPMPHTVMDMGMTRLGTVMGMMVGVAGVGLPGLGLRFGG